MYEECKKCYWLEKSHKKQCSHPRGVGMKIPVNNLCDQYEDPEMHGLSLMEKLAEL